ncbi:MAG: alpha/beta fold hydrolase [Reyranella sp.]
MSDPLSRTPWPGSAFPAQFFLWPLIAASEVVAAQAGGFARLMATAGAAPDPRPKPEWTTPNRVRLDLTTMELRDFSTAAEGATTLVCAPFALHGATISDFAAGHSLVQTLADNGCRRIFVTDWRSATRDMRLLTIDNYLAELNVAIDEIGAPVDLVGLCQGGVMALIYAARFPSKIRKLVLAGAPVDLEAGASLLSLTARNLPLGLFDEVVRLVEGRVLGQRVIDLWGPALRGQEGAVALQIGSRDDSESAALLQRFRAWYDWTVDLPGAYYHQTVLWLFKENRLAEGRFTALGREIDLGEVRQPIFLLAARDDELVAPGQLMAVRRLVGTKPENIESVLEPCSHLGLFVGSASLAGGWSRAARWLAAGML